MLVHFQAAEIARPERARDDPGAAACCAAIQAEALQMYDQRIAGPCAFHIERSRQRIAAGGAADAIFIDASGVDTFGLHCVARKDMQRRRDVPSEVDVEDGWLELVRRWSARRRRGRAFSDELERAFEVGAFPLDLVALDGDLYFPGVGIVVLGLRAFAHCRN